MVGSKLIYWLLYICHIIFVELLLGQHFPILFGFFVCLVAHFIRLHGPREKQEYITVLRIV